jgi:hypothetical protein
MRAYCGVVILCSLLLSPLTSAARPGPPHSISFSSAPKQNIAPDNITPVCLDRSNIPPEDLHWLAIPNSPTELATSEDYGFLSGQLIQSGAVDAHDCPLGGLWPGGYANGCGLEKTRQASLYLQNVYDGDILAAGKSTGVPPVMIKRLIRYESQFWPTQWGYYHFGLGHLTEAGATAALFWNINLWQSVYAQSQSSDNMPRQLLSLMDATCPTCSLKIDVPKAERSVGLLAEVLLGICKQTTQVIYNATRETPGDVVDYATVWRLTLLNYNAGPQCVFDAVQGAHHYGALLNWTGIANYLNGFNCIRGVAYSDMITAPYYNFGTAP